MPVKIRFESELLRRTCERRREAVAAWGEPDALVLRRRLDDLHASRHVDEFLSLPHVRHRLEGDLLHVSITQRWFLVIATQGGFGSSAGRMAGITSVTIMGVKDARAP